MTIIMKAVRTGLISLAVASAPVHAANSPASSLSLAQAVSEADVMKLPVCRGKVTTDCRKKSVGAGGNAIWIVIGAGLLAGAIVAASPGSPSSP